MSNTSDSDTMLHHLIPDPAMRKRLLNQANLEFLAPLYDFEPHVVAHMLANGMRPEDLLVEILKREPAPNSLILQLDLKETNAKRASQSPRTTSAEEEAPYLKRLQEMIPDADQRERLLDIENLVFLLHLYDFRERDKDRMRAAGMMPVDVLLVLLSKEPDPRKLIIQLNLRDAEAQQKAKNGVEKPKNGAHYSVSEEKRTNLPWLDSLLTALEPFLKRLHISRDNFRTVMAGLVGLCTISLAESSVGFASFAPRVRSQEMLTLIAALGGVMIGIAYRKYVRSYVVSIFLGVVGNIGMLWATLVYLRDKSWITSNETVLPALAGSLPAFALYYLFFRKKDDA